MTITRNIPIPSESGWVLIARGCEHTKAIVQMASAGAVIMTVGQNAPPSDSDDGFVLQGERQTSHPVMLDAADALFVKCWDNEDEEVVLMAS